MAVTGDLAPLVQKLRSRSPLDGGDCDRILALPHVVQRHHALSYILREGDRPLPHCCMVRTGFAFGQKLTAQGDRQIVSVRMAGELLDAQMLFLERCDHNMQALTDLELVAIQRAALQQLILARPAVARALWIDTLVDASVHREWVLNVGRRDARARIAHLLCELALRARAAGIGTETRFELPMTQEQLGDAVGLTAVHVNRTLKSLAADGVVQRDKRFVQLCGWDEVRAIGDFNALYLHHVPLAT